MHVATHKPNVVELDAGSGEVEARRSEAEGRGVLAGDLAPEPDVVVDSHSQFEGELVRTVGDFGATVHADDGEEA